MILKFTEKLKKLELLIKKEEESGFLSIYLTPFKFLSFSNEYALDQ